MDSGSNLFTRHPANPVLSAADWPYVINTVFNPAAALVGDETVLLCRVEDRRGLSHLTVARSADGVGGWRIDPKPLLSGDENDPVSRWGLEDPRVTWSDDLHAWLIAYTAYGPEGPCVAMATTRDFVDVEELGVAMPPEDKNASLLPRRVDDQYVLFHRPASAHTGRADIWLSRSSDLRSWTHPEPVLAARPGGWWDSVRIGMGPPPIATDEGWLAVYHGVRQTTTGSLYRVGLALLDLENPAVVLRRSDEWVLGPDLAYERHGDVPNVIFPTGLIHNPDTDELRLYYGAADTCIGLATGRLAEVVEYLLSCPAGTAPE